MQKTNKNCTSNHNESVGGNNPICLNNVGENCVFPHSKGITLIALIITIIVMIILVGVTVSIALNGGLFTVAKDAATSTKKAMLQEELNVIIASMNADLLSNSEKYTASTSASENETYYFFEEILKALENNFLVDDTLKLDVNDGNRDFQCLNFEEMYIRGLVTINEEEMKYTLTVPCTYKENSINIIIEMNIDNEGNMKVTSFALEELKNIYIEQIGETPVVSAGGNIKSVTDEGVPIPKGFYYVTGTKNTGVVISDNSADENNAEGNNGNQFVWVPVEVNPKLKIEIDSDKIISEIKLLNADGYNETINPNSHYFDKTIDITNNTVYEITIKYADGSIDNELYEINSAYEKAYQPFIIVKSLAILSDMTLDEMLDYLKQNITDDIEFNNNIDLIKETAKGTIKETEDFAEETNSVLKYGGFYIARYEVGSSGAIKKGIYPKHSISYEDAKTEAEAMYNDNNLYGVKSAIPSGAAWDSIGRWLVNSRAKKYEDVYATSREWGNFHPQDILVNGKLNVCGSNSKYRVNNIYDLAGNVGEFTTEIEIEESGNVYRGGSYTTLIGSFNSTSVGSQDTYIGYRPILYFYE